MRQLTRQERLRVASTITTKPVSLAAPIKGWNTRDALDAMDPLDAITLENWYPDQGGCTLRNGYTTYSSLGTSQSFSLGFSAGFDSQTIVHHSVASPVKTLAWFRAGAISKFIAAAGGGFYDISASGGSGPPIKGGFTSDEWQYVPFLSRLFFVNGADTAQVYDGTSFADASFTGTTLTTLKGVALYQQRLFFWTGNQTGFWYAQLNSITGALAFYDLAAFSPNGGNLIAVTSYSHDGGQGVSDFIVFIMSSGDALIYFGNDPGDAANWQEVALYRISPPVNIRAVCQYGAEAFVTTFDDHVPLQQQLIAQKDGAIPPRSKVSTAVQLAVQANGSGFGWQALYYPRGRRLIFNIPNTNGTFSQHVQNTGVQYQDKNGKIVSPWCLFTNMNAYCWGLFNDLLYFGGADGVVYQADTGGLDSLGAISASAQQSWNTLKSASRKQVTAVRPLVQSVGTVALSFAIGFDYGEINIPNTIALAAQGSPWDVSPWDTSPWSAEQVVSTAWRASGGSGTAIGIGLDVSAVQSATWLRSDLRIQTGNAF